MNMSEWNNFENIVEFDTAGIGNVDVSADEGALAYTLQGQRIDKSYNGIVIKNGRKYVRK